MTEVSSTKAFTAASTRVQARLILAGAMFGLIIVSGCQPKATSQTARGSQPVQAAVVPAGVTAPEPNVAEVPQQARAPHAAPAQKTASRVTEPEDAAAGGKAITIAGGWVNAGGACDSGASVFFNPDGTYMSEGEKGTWALAGKTLTVTTSSTEDEAQTSIQGPDESTGDSGEKAVLTLLSLTDDTARVVLSNGNSANWTRCNS